MPPPRGTSLRAGAGPDAGAQPAGHPDVLPLRPLTTGELIDSAVGLLRLRAPVMLGLGFVLAAAEQLALYPLRRLADVGLQRLGIDIHYWPADDRWAEWMLLVAVGFATEAVVIALLGAPASVGALRAVLGPAAPPWRVRDRMVAVSVVAVVAGLGCGLAVLTGYGWPWSYFLLIPVTLMLWAVVYGLVGLAVPAVVVDRLGPGRALLRSVRLSVRGGMRALRVRSLAYLSWFLVRLAWGTGVLWLIGLFYIPPDTRGDVLLLSAVFLAVNTLAYPVLASLDAVLHVAARVRSEGLDIALRRALVRGEDPTPLLVRTGSGSGS